VPIHELLGGAAQSRVMAYASATALLARPDGAWDRKTPDHLVNEIRRYAQQGYRAIKFGWGNHFTPEDQQILAAMRQAIGPDIRLMLDFGNPAYWAPGWYAQRALAVAKVCEEHGIYFLEEPLPPHDVDGFAELSKAAIVRIATGEMLCAPHEFTPFVDRRAADILQPDAARIGITPFVEVARRADQAGIPTVPHSPWSALAIAAHVNVLATLSSCEMVESPADGLYTDEGHFWGETTRIMTDQIVETPLKVVGGLINLPRSPGLGVGGFVPAAVERLKSLAQEYRQ
jgi:D-galactarolactone cycloisomerase